MVITKVPPNKSCGKYGRTRALFLRWRLISEASLPVFHSANGGGEELFHGQSLSQSALRIRLRRSRSTTSTEYSFPGANSKICRKCEVTQSESESPVSAVPSGEREPGTGRGGHPRVSACVAFWILPCVVCTPLQGGIISRSGPGPGRPPAAILCIYRPSPLPVYCHRHTPSCTRTLTHTYGRVTDTSTEPQ